MHRLCWVDETTGWLPQIAQAREPVALGVHAALTAPTSPSLPVGDSTRRAPAYVPRDVDQVVDQTLTVGGFALLVGDSTSGKSRSAYEALRRLPAHWSLLVPRDGAALRELLDDGLELKEAVVWLDDLERFLGPGGLDPALLRRVHGNGDGSVAILATMRASELRSRLPDATVAATSARVLQADQQVLLAAERVNIARSLSSAEQRRARELTDDTRIAAALRHLGDFGLGEYLADGPRAWRRWRQALDTATPVEAHVGAALTAAAVDCRRAGIVRPLEAAVLRELAAL